MPVADVSEGKDFPVAPLFATASIVPDEASHAVEEVDMPTAEATLNALDKVARSFEAKPRLPVPPRAAQPLLIRPLARQGWLIFCILTSVSLLTASMILLQRSQASLDDCKSDKNPPAGWQFLSQDITNRLKVKMTDLQVNGSMTDGNSNDNMTAELFTLSLDTVCRLTTGDDWHGAPQWRWLLFFALWPALGLLGYVLAWGIAAAVLALEGSGLFLVLTMHSPLGSVIRCILWTISWRLLMDDASKWAHDADGWNTRAGMQVWDDDFRDVHYYMLRALIAYLLFEVASLLRQTVSSYLAVRFHHKKFFNTMQRALVHEHSIKALSGPSSTRPQRTIRLHSQRSVAVGGMQVAHWEAVKFLTRFADACGSLALRGKHTNTEEEAARLRTRANKLKARMAAVLAASINAKSDVASAKARARVADATKGEATSGETTDALVAITPTEPPVTTEDIEQAAVASLDGSAVAPDGRQMSLKAIPEVTQDEENDAESDVPESGFVELAMEAADAFEKLDDCRLTRMAKVATGWTPQDVAAELASKHNEATTKVWFLVSILQEYFLTRPYMRVALHGDTGSKECVESAQFARQLGYLMFFKLKRDDAALVISEREIQDAEKAAGLDNAHTGRLFNRDGDLSSTLQEFMEGTQRVHREREVLANTLIGNVAVVRQVEKAIGATLLVVWVFIAAAIFDPGAVQRTWTALSAGLLSFSFIFSSTIRELFENAIYLFSVQPFDPSDVIVFGGTRYTVSRITLLSVELTRGDGAIVTITTTAMREMQVHNVTRSGQLQEELQFSVDRMTPHEKLKGVAHYVQACIRDHPKLYNGTYTMWWSASSGDKLQLSVAFDHKTNGEDLLQTQIAKTYMYDAVAVACAELGIQCSSSLNLSLLDKAVAPPSVAGTSSGGPSGPPEGPNVMRVAAGATVLGQM